MPENNNAFGHAGNTDTAFITGERKDLFVTAVGPTDSGASLFQIPAFEKGSNRFTDDSPKKAIPLLEFCVIYILERLITTIEDLPSG